PVALMMLDVDHFKSINDRFGHAAGDAALQSMAEVILSSHRVTDVAGRIGGEEFAILLPETTRSDAAALAERLRVNSAERQLIYSATPIRLTVSIGVAAWSAVDTLDALMIRADAALYEAKQTGRDRVVTA